MPLNQPIFNVQPGIYLYIFSSFHIKTENPIECVQATATVDAGPGVTVKPVNTFPCRSIFNNSGVQQTGDKSRARKRREKLALGSNEMLLLPWLLSSFLLSSPLSLLLFLSFSISLLLFSRTLRHTVWLSVCVFVRCCVFFFVLSSVASLNNHFWCVRTDVLCNSLFSQFQLRARCVCFNITQTHNRTQIHAVY